MTWTGATRRIAVGLSFFSSAASAQATAGYASIDALYFSGRPADALAACDLLLSRDSTNFDVLWRASRAAVALGMTGDRQDPDTPAYVRADALARLAVRVRPDRIEGQYWLAAASGRRALHADLRPAIRFANTTLESATRVLAMDSLYAGGHHVLGKLNLEVSKLPAFTRFVAGRILGVSVVRAMSWEGAELHLRRAVELDSTMILYRVDLAELYLRTGRKPEAMRNLRAALALPRVHPIDAKLQSEARATLDAR